MSRGGGGPCRLSCLLCFLSCLLVPSGGGLHASNKLLSSKTVEHAHGLQGYGVSLITEVSGPLPAALAAAATSGVVQLPLPFDELVGPSWPLFYCTFTGSPSRCWAHGGMNQRRMNVAIFAGATVRDSAGKAAKGPSDDTRPKLQAQQISYDMDLDELKEGASLFGKYTQPHLAAAAAILPAVWVETGA